ncbi:MAG: thioredoxin-dependent thiol peroxidase [Bacteroidales bacterium]|jgi:peroxiredoxin Q/BCP|nr:thioredoxin-dependent thiol peroxidase [Bacteroidales bacterium]MCK9499143.1 thioredoxin-dependent thiol peroxidase [Bacteroidales bacterium]MDY0314496.1 thioredoxin-dependent thiol peroxidase [Bacteroidales bacterium]NLB86792.1 thioredoxin-dependent thiol peroxidase [Bacteroidales bacterium]
MNKLEIGSKAPDFKGLNQDGKEIKLSDFAGKNLILYFYPKDSTPGCTAEACDLRDNYDMWLSKSYEVLGISPDSQKSHQNFIEKHNLPFDLISDTEKEILIVYNAWGEKSMYGRKYMGVLRKTYVINSEGIIENIFDKVKTKDHSNQIIKEII